MTPTHLARRTRRIVTTLAVLASGVIGICAAAPAAFASPLPPPGGSDGSHAVGTVLATGMPGWQIALIAIAAALVASIAAVALDRARLTRRHPAPQPS